MADFPTLPNLEETMTVAFKVTIQRWPWDHTQDADHYLIWAGYATMGAPDWRVHKAPAGWEFLCRDGTPVPLFLRSLLYDACLDFERGYRRDHERYVREYQSYLEGHGDWQEAKEAREKLTGHGPPPEEEIVEIAISGTSHSRFDHGDADPKHDPLEYALQLAINEAQVRRMGTGYTATLYTKRRTAVYLAEQLETIADALSGEPGERNSVKAYRRDAERIRERLQE